MQLLSGFCSVDVQEWVEFHEALRSDLTLPNHAIVLSTV